MIRRSTIAAMLIVLAAIPALADGEKPKFVDVDYAKLEKRILKEPKYVAEPRYALLVLDREAKQRTWVVLDKSSRDARDYDVLYFDFKGNGDLTDPADRIVAEGAQEKKFSIARVEAPGLAHTQLRIELRDGRLYFSMLWDGKVSVAGGWGGPTMYGTELAAKPEDAPVLRPTAEGALALALRDDCPTLKIGGSSEVYVLCGNRGSGRDTLCAVSDRFLESGKDRIFITIFAKDVDGNPLQIKSEIKGHC